MRLTRLDVEGWLPATKLPTGTVPIGRIVLIRNNKVVHTVAPDTKEADFEHRDDAAERGGSYHCARAEQSDGSLAWVSPIRVTYRSGRCKALAQP